MKDINIILTRHGRYNDSRDKSDWSIGHITEEGKREIAEKTKKRIDRMVGNKLRDTTFLIIASPTYWLSDKRFGTVRQPVNSLFKFSFISLPLKLLF